MTNENNKNIITRIILFIKQLFSRNNIKMLPEGRETKDESIATNKSHENPLRERITIPKDPERERLLALREKWENGEIEEDEMDEKDVDAIVAIYDEETEKLEKETEIIKQKTALLLKELKNQ